MSFLQQRGQIRRLCPQVRRAGVPKGKNLFSLPEHGELFRTSDSVRLLQTAYYRMLIAGLARFSVSSAVKVWANPAVSIR